MNRKPTESETKRIKSIVAGIAEELGLTLANPEAIQSRHSYNKYVFEYESLFSEIPLEMIIETNFYQAVYPVETREVYSFVGKFCEKRGISLPISFDAVFAVCDYRLQDMQDRDSRHLYDIAKLFPKVEINDELEALIDEVREDRMQSRNNPSAQPEHNIPEMLKEIINSRFYESDYNNITKKLLYEDVPYDEAIACGIAKVAELDVFEYKKK